MAEINGTSGHDTLVGTSEADVINAGDGVDKVTAGAGNDVLYGGAGNDNMNGELGDDRLYGEAGNDSLNGSSGYDELYGGDGNDNLYGGGENDKLYGGAGNDLLAGDGNNDQLEGGEGNDRLFGGTGNDTLDGGAGTDTLNGDAGDDILKVSAGEGGDTVSGGTGSDTLVLSLASADLTSAFRSDLAALVSWMEEQRASAGGASGLAQQSAGASFTITSLGLTITLVEALTVMVDGAVRDIASLLNQTPEADPEASIATEEDTPVAGQVIAVDGDGDQLSFALADGPAHGSLALDAATGHYTYVPDSDFNGSDSFAVTVSDSSGASVTQVISVAVTGINDAPEVAGLQSLATDEDTVVSGQVAASDVDGDTLSYFLATAPANGIVTLNVETGAYSYMPAAGFSGTDSFVIMVDDGVGGSAAQQIAVTIAPIADAPILSLQSSLANPTAEANGDNTVIGTASSDLKVGGQGNDRIAGGNGNDSLYGDVGAEFSAALVIAAALADTDGSELLGITISGVPAGARLSAGHDNGDGSWTLTSAELAGLALTTTSAESITLTVTATAGEQNGTSATVSGELLVTFVADAGGADTLVGGAGNDTLYGGSGDDLIYGGSVKLAWMPSIRSNTSADDDVVFGGDGNDRIIGGNGHDALYGESGNDTVQGGKGVDLLDGGDGADMLIGDSGNDVLFGGEGNDSLKGMADHDVISDGAGNDVVDGGSGNDVFLAGAGNDTYKGGSGIDTLDYSGSTSAIVVDVSKKTVAGLGNDTLSSIERIIGSDFADAFKGSKAVDTLSGGGGDDTFRGMEGADILTGGAGADTFTWFGKDVMSGNKHLGVDTITDFGAGDRLDISDLTKGNASGKIVLTDAAQGTVLSVKIGNAFQDVVLLEGVHGLTVEGLLSADLLLV